MFRPLYSLAKTLGLFVLVAVSPITIAKNTVNVALTSIQPPFVFRDPTHSGLIRDLVSEMNRTQDKYEFVLNIYPPSRIVKYHESLKVDLIAFNDLKWGWDKQGGQGSLSLTDGKDVFFSFKGKDSISKTSSETIAAVRGFHYKFADFDPSALENNPLIYPLENETDVVEFMSYKRADKGVSSKAYLDWLSVSEPQVHTQIEVLEEDHSYTRRFIAMPRSIISIEEVNQILIKLNSIGLLQRIFARYGQDAPPLK